MNNCICSAGGGLTEEIKSVKVTEYVDPSKNGGSFEVIGIMNDSEKSMFTVLTRVSGSIKEKIELIKKGEISVNESRSLAAEIGDLHDKHRMLKGLLFFSIQDRLNIWNKQLSLSQGFKIVEPIVSEEEICGHCISIEIPGADKIMEVLSSFFKKAEGFAKEGVNTTTH